MNFGGLDKRHACNELKNREGFIVIYANTISILILDRRRARITVGF
jgi:hypothetical protein